jgi:hypothetical protein
MPRFCVSCSCRPLLQRNPPWHALGAAGQGRYYLYSSTLVGALGLVEVPSTFHAFREGAGAGAVAACELCVMCGVRLPQIRAQHTSLKLTLSHAHVSKGCIRTSLRHDALSSLVARLFGNFPRQPLPHLSALRSSHVCRLGRHLLPCLATVVPRTDAYPNPQDDWSFQGPFSPSVPSRPRRY